MNSRLPCKLLADHLDIDGSRQAEIKNLRHHIHGQGVKDNARELDAKLGAEILHVAIGGMVLFGQRHGDVGIAALTTPVLV